MSRTSDRLYLQWVFGADGQDLVLAVAEFTAPGASLTYPADEAGLVSAAHGAIAATGAQQLPLQDTNSSCMRHPDIHGLILLNPPATRFDLVEMKIKIKIAIRNGPNW